MEIERYRPLAQATALALLGDHHLAEDAVQDALLEALRNWERLREPEKRAAWVRAIVRHRCYRTLRRRDLGATTLPELATSDEPWQRVAGREERGRLMSQVRSLPAQLREVVALHYLSGCSHRETAAFLGVPATTVNNRLHVARRLLKGGTAMQSTPHTPFAGTVISVEEPVVDVRFTEDGAPDIFDALAAAEATPNLRVTQLLGDGVVRCVMLGGEAPRPGQRMVNRTADGGTHGSVLAQPEHLGRIAAAMSEERDGLIETGIKPVDLFCPLPARGSVALMGTSGTGKMVLTVEIAQRLDGNGPRIFCLSDRQEPALIRDLAGAEEDLDHRVVWLVSSEATNPVYASTNTDFDASIYTTPLLGIRGLWPAVDPLRSRSTATITDRHARIADEARDLIRTARERTLDPELLELLAVRAYGAARQRLQSTTDSNDWADDPLVARARRLEAFLTHPFDVGKDITGKDGETVSLADTLDGVEAILRGELDDVDPAELMYVGKLPA